MHNPYTDDDPGEVKDKRVVCSSCQSPRAPSHFVDEAGRTYKTCDTCRGRKHRSKQRCRSRDLEAIETCAPGGFAPYGE